MAKEIGSGFVEFDVSNSQLRLEALNHAVKLRMSTNVKADIAGIVADADEMYQFLTGQETASVSLPADVAKKLTLSGGGSEIHFASGSVSRWSHDCDGLRVELNEEQPAF